MKKVKIYKIECTEAQMMCELGTRWSWNEWGANTREYHGDTIDFQEVVVPDSFEWLSTNGGGKEPFVDGKHCVLITSQEGEPFLVVGHTGIAYKLNSEKLIEVSAQDC